MCPIDDKCTCWSPGCNNWLAECTAGAQIVAMASEINCRATKSHSFDNNVLLMHRCRISGDQKIAGAQNRFPGDPKRRDGV